MTRTVRTCVVVALFSAVSVAGLGLTAQPAAAHGSCSFTATHPFMTSDGIRGSGWIQCSFVHNVYSMTLCIQFRAAPAFDWDNLGCRNFSADNANSNSFVRSHTEPCFETGFYRTWMDGSVGTAHTTPAVVSGDSGILHTCLPI